ncbi:MAG: immunoglobulin domain-containing protein, partial [Verrucomicrobiota bacterium]
PTNDATLPLGTNLVIIAVADPYGNTAYSTNTIVVQDQTPPQILVQPQSQTNTAGANVSISVAATACTPLAFLWLSNNVALATQTNSVFIISNLNLAAAGNYAVVVSAAGGSVTSAVVTLTVSIIPPGISHVAVNSNGSIALNLTGSPGSTYKLEAATNLTAPIDWFDIATNTLGTNYVWQFTDLQATNFRRQFYRLMLAP